MKKNVFAVSVFLMLCTATNIWAQVQAVKSDDFVERIGVCTHFDYTDLPYVTNFTTVKTKLGELGVRYFRDGPDPDYTPYNTKVKDICSTYGMKMQAVFPAGDYLATGSGYNASLVAGTLDKIKNNIGTQYYIGIEGLNEPENINDNDPNWPATTRAVQQAIYSKMKSDAAWNNVKVLGPSVFDYPSFQMVGDLRSMSDYGNMHWYPQDREPSATDAAYFSEYYDLARQYCYNDSRPIVLSETGYTNQNTLAVPESVTAKYILRNMMYLLYTKNMNKVFNYQFLDEGTDLSNFDQTWGLLHSDCSEKPAYRALKNTISLLKEPGANFNPGQLAYTLTGNMTNIYQKLFQKSNGTFYLIIWQDARSYNLTSKQIINVAERGLTLNLPAGIGSAKIYRPTPSPIGNGLTPTNIYTNPTSIELSVPDQIMIIELIPGTNVTGSLTGSVALNTTAVNLSTVGTNDWKHFDNNDHKATGGMINSISNYSVIGGAAASYSNDLRKMSWTGGTPAASSSNNGYGWYKAGIGNGFSFTVAAGNGNNTLKVYAGGFNAGGTLTAHLSNSAAADYVNTRASTAGQWGAVYTINYNAAQAGQTLTLTWKQASGTGNVTIQGAALVGTAKRIASIPADTEEPAITSIGIYPNPATDYTNINFGKTLNNEKVQVAVIDLSGKRIYQSGKLSAVSTLQLNTGKYAKGTYIIKITKGLESVNKKLVIK
jgi:Secretion system C-terminal sorting domain